MANYISKIKLPSGTTYDIKDASAWSAISSLTGISFSVAWNGQSTPTVANIPEGVVVTYNGTSYTGTKTAASANTGTFYLVYSSTQKDSTDIYDEYIVITDGSTKKWEKIGDTGARFSDIVLKKYTTNALTGVKVTQQPVVGTPGTSKDEVLGSATTFTASKPSVTVTNSSTYIGASVSGGDVDTEDASVVIGYSNPSKDNALGTGATFTTSVTPTTTKLGTSVTGGSVSVDSSFAAITGFGTHTTKKVLGSSATFTTNVTPTTTNIKATASGGGYSSPNTSTFVKSYPGTTSKLVTTSITGVSGSTTATKVTTGTQTTATGDSSATAIDSDWLKGVTVTGETLTIGACVPVVQTTTQVTGNSSVTVPTAASAKTVATGSLAADGTGASVMTGLGTAVTASAITSLGTFTAPTVGLATGATAGTGVISVATGIDTASTTVNNKDEASAITALGTPTTQNAVKTISHTNPTVSITSGNTSGVEVMTGATAGTTVNNADTVSAITALGTPSTIKAITSATYTSPSVSLSTYSATATGRAKIVGGATAELSAAPSITVGTNDKVNAVISVSAPSLTTNVAVGDNGTAEVLLSTTDVSVNS